MNTKERTNEPERVLLRVRPAVMSLVPGLFLPSIVSIVAATTGARPILWFGLGWLALAALRALFKWDEAYWVLTNRRVIAYEGIFSTTTRSIWLEDIRGVELSHPFWGRIFGYASAGFCTAGTSGVEVRVRNIRRMSAFIRAVEQARTM